MAIGDALGKLLGKSPLAPLQEHFAKVHAAASLLPALTTAAQADDWERASTLHAELKALAADADKLKLALRMQLRKSMFMPVARSDLLELLATQDLLADESELAANLIMTRKQQLPDKLLPAFGKYLGAIMATVDLARDAVMELDEVFEVGFGKQEIDLVYAKLKSLARQEVAAKKLEEKLRARLFSLEQSLPPLDAMFIYQLVDRVSTMGRHAERVGNRLLILLSV